MTKTSIKVLFISSYIFYIFVAKLHLSYYATILQSGYSRKHKNKIIILR